MAKAKTLSLRDLADQLADSAGISKAAAYDAAKGMFDGIAKAVHAGGKVSVHGFGAFSLKERKARTGRNPQTGAAIKVPASKTLGFKAVPSQKKTGKK